MSYFKFCHKIRDVLTSFDLNIKDKILKKKSELTVRFVCGVFSLFGKIIKFHGHGNANLNIDKRHQKLYCISLQSILLTCESAKVHFTQGQANFITLVENNNNNEKKTHK